MTTKKGECPSDWRWWVAAAWPEAHLQGYEELLEKGETRFRIVAAVDEVPARAEDFAARINGFAGWEVNAYASVAELLAGEDALDGG